jgi:small neutral amino acid transporter SnatA (MarC family)
MNLALAALAVLATTPVVRGRLALGTDPSPAARSSALGALAGLAMLTVLVGPALAAAADVSAPTVRIAAGLVIAVTSIPDLWRRPLVAERTDPPWRAGVIPVAFPELFGPPLAAALTATAMDLGVGPAIGLAGVAVLAVAGADRLPGERTGTGPLRALAGLRAAAAIAVGIALVMNGVFDI